MKRQPKRKVTIHTILADLDRLEASNDAMLAELQDIKAQIARENAGHNKAHGTPGL